MPFLKETKRNALVGAVLKLLLEKLVPRTIILDNLTPGFYPNRNTIIFINESPVAIWKRMWSDRFWQLRSFLALQYFGRFRSEADKYQRRS